MKIYAIKLSVQGYCRGEEHYVVEAASPEEARDLVWSYSPTESFIVRDDREREIESVEEIT